MEEVETTQDRNNKKKYLIAKILKNTTKNFDAILRSKKVNN
jgi:hypothetical protein